MNTTECYTSILYSTRTSPLKIAHFEEYNKDVDI